MKKALFILDAEPFQRIYGLEAEAQVARWVELVAPPQTRDTVHDNPGILRDVEIILSGWGAPRMDEAFLASAPRLEAVFYGAGSLRGMVTPAFWARNIVVTSSYAANGIPVAEFCLAQILFALKAGWRNVHHLRTTCEWEKQTAPGAYGSTVGIVSLGMIGRLVCEHLKRIDVRVVAYDPFVTPETARDLQVTLCPLDEVFRISDVVSLHTPWLKETERMVRQEHVEAMKPGATFINTARGAVVDEPGLIRALQARRDLTAVLDVTHPEPPAPDSPLWSMPNVVLTPHIAGSIGGECRRMGQYAIEECGRYLRGETLRWRITREMSERMA
jgi:phosphoglycerate dehydrogenase-like enzyme